ncbi:MAG: EamA family transporter, partial [Chloroflexota bacterium]|nr:EamA family transporter [Chloroflexota bacterium]
FAIDFVIAKHLLRGLATLTVMTARMTIGTAMLFVYAIATGHLAPIAQLGPTQWEFVIVTGVILLAFTATTFTAIRHASVSTVLAVGTAAPMITVLLQTVSTGKLKLNPTDFSGLALIVLAAIAVIIIGVRQDEHAARLQGA